MAPKTAANPMMEKMHKALAYQKAGEFAKAQKIYKLVLKKLPDNADANHLLGVTYRQLGDPETAIKYIEKAIKLSPGQGVFYSNLARAHSDIPASGPEAILENAEKALLLNPNIVEAHNLKAIALSKLNRNDEAEEIFKLLISKVPGYADANSNYGLLLRDQKRYAEAVDFFDRAVKLDPANPENYIQRARARMEGNDFQQSRTELEQALGYFGDHADLLHELARVLFRLGENKLALPIALKAQKLSPDDPHKLVTAGIIEQSLGRYKDSIKALEKALEKQPTDLGTLKWNLALAYLGDGDLENGWDLYENRFQLKAQTVLKRVFDRPEWDGSPLNGKTLLLWADQGIGDAIKHGTLLPEVRAAGGKIIIEVSAKLVPPFQKSFPDFTTRVARFEPLTLKATADDFDYHISMSSLGQFYRRRIEDFKRARHPVFKFDQERARAFYARLDCPRSRPIVGVSWRSRNLSPERAASYLSAPEIAPILETPGITFVNLQYVAIQKEIDFLVEGRGVDLRHFEDVDQFNNLLDAAALSSCCDLVITANTSVSDIAGCFGIPCWSFGQPAGHFQLGQPTPPWYENFTYTYVSEGEPVVSLVPELVSRLEGWRETFSPEARLKRLGLSE